MKDDLEIKFEIAKALGVLGESARGWKTELNLVSWNEREPKLDIRSWDPEHKRMGKGITLTKDEGKALRDALDAYLRDGA